MAGRLPSWSGLRQALIKASASCPRKKLIYILYFMPRARQYKDWSFQGFGFIKIDIFIWESETKIDWDKILKVLDKLNDGIWNILTEYHIFINN